jgi:hypothetical protein
LIEGWSKGKIEIDKSIHDSLIKEYEKFTELEEGFMKKYKEKGQPQTAIQTKT